MSNDIPMPHDPKAEIAVLGSILLDNSTLVQAQEKLQTDDFYLQSHRLIFRAMETLAENHRPIDFVTLADALGDDLAKIGGDVYLTSVTDGLPRVKNITSYCEIVSRHAGQRRIVHAAKAAAVDAVSGGEPLEVSSRLQAELDAVNHKTEASKCVPVAMFGDDMSRKLIADYDSGGQFMGLPTGIPTLDSVIGGLVAGENVVIGGRTGAGKTALALNIVEHLCSQGIPVTFFSFEMSKEDLVLRLAAKQVGIPVYSIRNKDVTREEMLSLIEAIQNIKRWSLHIDDRSSITPKELLAVARMQAQRGCRLFVCDHLAVFSENCEGHTIREKINAASATIKRVAKENKIAVLNLCQLSRPEDKETPGKPGKYDLKESGNIENDGHAVILLHRELKKDESGQVHATGNDSIIVAKNRSGPEAEIPAHFDGRLMVWKEIKPIANVANGKVCDSKVRYQ